MKKIWSLLFVLLLSFTLNGCVELTYDSVYETYTSYIEENRDDYEDVMAFYNAINDNIVKGTIMVKSSIDELGYSAIGSGFIYAQDDEYYYALTNSHVIGADTTFHHFIQAVNHKGESSVATLVAYDTDYDLAVIKFLKGDQDLIVIDFADANPDHKMPIIVLGHPSGQLNAITMGYYIDLATISLDDQAIGTVDFYVLKLNAPVEPGSSGSVVINESSLVVGVIFAGNYTDDTGATTFSYAIPIEKVKEFLGNNDLQEGNLS